VPDFFRSRKWDLVGKRRYWYAVSAVVIGACLYALIARGLNYGIDFTGGGLLTYQVPRPIPAAQQDATTADVRRTIDRLAIPNFVQVAGAAVGAKNLVLVRTQFPQGVKSDAERNAAVERQSDRILTALQRDPRFKGIRLVSQDVVGSVVSKELISKALWAVGLGSIFILLWIAVRYDFKFSVTAIAALLHDVLVLLGTFAFLQRQVESPFVAAILTVVGYSVHDTIVIFDRIRENLRLHKGATFAETANISLLETMARSVNTVLTVEFTLLALYFFGGATLHDFVLALLVGVTTGGYSSIFIASQLLTGWKEREARSRLAARGAPAAAPSRREPVAEAPRMRPQPQPAAAQPDPAAAPEPSGSAPDQAQERAKAKRKAGAKARKRKKRF
jgi:preprotein translocase subunit SecF